MSIVHIHGKGVRSSWSNEKRNINVHLAVRSRFQAFNSLAVHRTAIWLRPACFQEYVTIDWIVDVKSLLDTNYQQAVCRLSCCWQAAVTRQQQRAWWLMKSLSCCHSSLSGNEARSEVHWLIALCISSTWVALTNSSSSDCVTKVTWTSNRFYLRCGRVRCQWQRSLESAQ